MLKCFKCLFMASMLSFYPLISFAGSFEVAPTTLSLQAEARSGALYITNQGDNPVTIQIEPFEWQQSGNEDILVPTEDLMISPPLVKFLPKDKQTIRLALNPEATSQKKSFRVILSELATTNDANGQAIRVLLQFNVPIFIESQKEQTTALEWFARKQGSDMTLTAKNTGSRYVKLSNLQVTPSGQSSINVMKKDFQYILPNAEYTWEVKGLSLFLQQKLAIQVNNEGKESISGTAVISE